MHLSLLHRLAAKNTTGAKLACFLLHHDYAAGPWRVGVFDQSQGKQIWDFLVCFGGFVRGHAPGSFSMRHSL